MYKRRDFLGEVFITFKHVESVQKALEASLEFEGEELKSKSKVDFVIDQRKKQNKPIDQEKPEGPFPQLKYLLVTDINESIKEDIQEEENKRKMEEVLSEDKENVKKIKTEDEIVIEN